MSLTEEEITERIQEDGALRSLITFEVAGKPQEHVEQTLDTYIEKLREDKALDVLDVHKEDAIELEDEEGFFSAFAEVEMLVPDLESLTHLCVNLMPASVEILAPDEFRFQARDVQNWSNDLLSRLHEIAQQLRAERQKNRYLNKNTQNLLQNMITILLANGPKDDEMLARLTGVKQEKIAQLLEQLDEQDIISKEGDKWILNSSQK